MQHRRNGTRTRITRALVALGVLGTALVVDTPTFRTETAYAAIATPVELAAATPGATVMAVGPEGAEEVPAASRTTERSSSTFTTIGVRVDRVPEETVSLRWRSKGQWSAWRPVEFNDDKAPDTESSEARSADARVPDQVSEPIWVGEADGYQIQGGGDLVGAGAEVVLVQPSARVVRVKAEPQQAQAQSFGRPGITPRSGWGARTPPSSFSTASELRLGVVHHADTANDYSPAEVPGILRSIQAFHMDSRGWGDIGYNFAVDRFGGMWEGRQGSLDGYTVGAHAQGFNNGSVGVVALGTYSAAAPSAAMSESIADILAWRFTNAMIDPTGSVAFTSGGSNKFAAGSVVTLPRIIGHRDVGQTDCPGNQLYGRLGDLRSLTAAKMGTKATPTGVIDYVFPGPGRLLVGGWAIDPSTKDPIDVHVWVDDAQGFSVRADVGRADLAALYPYYGGSHGYATTLTGIAPGNRRVCAWAINVGAGSNSLLGCRQVTVLSGSPIGGVDQVRAGPDGSIRVTGWAVDPDTTDMPPVHVYINGQIAGPQRMGIDRADVNAALPGYGGDHGFEFVGTGYGGGSLSVCVFGINSAGPGSNTLLSCQTVTAPAGSPFGVIDLAFGGQDGALTVSGWALDPDVSGPTEVHVYVGGQGYNLGPAAIRRPDVAAANPLYSDQRGYQRTITGLSQSTHDVCVFAINVGAGSNTLIGCRTVTMPSGSPYGVVDVAVGGPDGKLWVSGWARDPDTAAPTPVHVWVDNNVAHTFADNLRSDVGRAGYGNTFSGYAPGTRNACVFSLNSGGPGGNSLLRCAPFTVPGGSPFGVIDTATVSGGRVTLSGWTIDPDTANSIEAHIYINGVGYNAGAAAVWRADLDAAFPGYGPRHGYQWTSPALPPGRHQVCVFGINQGVGGNVPVACRDVTV